eukprot:sb/3477793/
MPIQAQLNPKKRQSQLVKFPSLPVTFRCLEQSTDNGLPISYSGFLLNEISDTAGMSGDDSPNSRAIENRIPVMRASAPAAPLNRISYEKIKERTQKVRRIMGNTS